MHAVILAGGFGTRLRSAVSDVPKPLAPIGGRPFLAWFIDVLIRQGITSVTLSVHHDWQKIKDYFTANKVSIPIHYAVEETPLGTGGAMAFALAEHAGNEPVIVLNGDSYSRVDYKALYAAHNKTGGKLTIVLRHVPDTSRYSYGAVAIEDGVITYFGEGAPGKPGLINAGVYVMDPKLFAENDMPQAFSFERDFLPPRLATLKPHAFSVDDYFIDIGVPADYARACKELPELLK
jgi:D-glycero-alpha-D-manno-heptose 1-phosphate guanylyltransferase